MIRTLPVVLALLMLAPPARGAEFALEEWLDEPGVKLVAVEFYADWCGPCKEAAPRWEALRKRYASQGLMLVVVNMGEEVGGGGRCSRLPWNPDASLCDPGLGKRLGVKGLPEAFVWSWQGNLLVERGKHVDEIEQIIRRYLDDNPRVQVMATGLGDKPDRALQRQVEGALGRFGKLTIVADAEMRKRLAAVRRESHAPSRRDDQQCRLGEEVSPNSVLQVERFEGAIALTLSDAVTDCQRATASAPWDPERTDRSIEKVTHKLMAKLKRREVEMPGASPVETSRIGSEVDPEVVEPFTKIVVVEDNGLDIPLGPVVLAGGGLVSLGAGVYVFMRGQADKDQVDDALTDGGGVSSLILTSAEMLSLDESATDKKQIGGVLMGLGVAAAAGGAYWWLSGREDPEDTQPTPNGPGSDEAPTEPDATFHVLPNPRGVRALVTF